MKKILAIMMSVVFAFTIFGLSGCGNEERKNESMA